MEPTVFATWEALFKECRLVHQFLNEGIRPRVQRAANASTDDFYGMLLRTISWLRSLWKLDEPADFQAVVVASRTLFEIAVDATLMHFDEASYPAAKVLAWEESAKLKASLKVKEFFAGKNRPPPPECVPQMQFIAANTKRIEALRVKYWPGRNGNGYHPARWTGHDLEHDASTATKLFGEGEFDEFYATQNAQLCWNTHGSGLAGVRGISPKDFPAISALGFRACARFALITAELILRHFGLWDDRVEREFAEHGAERVLTKYAMLTKNRTG